MSPLVAWLLALAAVPATLICEASERLPFTLGWFHLLGPIGALLIPVFAEPTITRKLMGIAFTSVVLFIVCFVAFIGCVAMFGFSAT